MKREKNNKAIFTYIKLSVTLLVICAITASLLSVVNSLTANKIANDKLLAVKAAVLDKETGIFPSSDDMSKLNIANYDTTPTDEGTTIEELYEVKKDGAVLGYCIKVNSKGFGGDIEMMIGTSVDGKVVGVRITSMSETAGLGTKIGETSHLSQYEGKNAADIEDNGIEIIAGATISSTALKNGVIKALSIKGLYGGGANE